MYKTTRGQEAIRTIIKNKLEFLKECNSAGVSISDLIIEKVMKNHTLMEEIIKEFSNNLNIEKDPVTGRYEGYGVDLSQEYVHYLYAKREEEKILTDSFPPLKLDAYIYPPTYSSPLSSRKPLYKCGDKYNTTLRALFTLANDQEVPMWDVDVSYFAKTGIIVSMAGTHRILAHVLWGEPNIKPNRMTIITESIIDPKFNEALLRLEKAGILFFLRFIDNYSDDEISNIKALAETSDKQLEILREYFKDAGKDRESIEINDFNLLVLELKQLQEMNIFKLIKFNLKKAFIPGNISQFEYWYFEYKI